MYGHISDYYHSINSFSTKVIGKKGTVINVDKSKRGIKVNMVENATKNKMGMNPQKGRGFPWRKKSSPHRSRKQFLAT